MLARGRVATYGQVDTVTEVEQLEQRLQGVASELQSTRTTRDELQAQLAALTLKAEEGELGGCADGRGDEVALETQAGPPRDADGHQHEQAGGDDADELDRAVRRATGSFTSRRAHTTCRKRPCPRSPRSSDVGCSTGSDVTNDPT